MYTNHVTSGVSGYPQFLAPNLPVHFDRERTPGLLQSRPRFPMDPALHY